mgnify:CR=1 FL=1
MLLGVQRALGRILRRAEREPSPDTCRDVRRLELRTRGLVDSPRDTNQSNGRSRHARSQLQFNEL